MARFLSLSLALLEALGEPLLVSTLLLPDSELPLTDGDEIRQKLERRVDLVIESGRCGVDMTTVIDLTGPAPLLIRAGLGPLAPLGLE